MTTPYTAFPNVFKHDLRAGRLLIGCWVALTSPITAEVIGLAGFDWLLLDGEHAPNDVTTLVPQLMALKDSASAPVVRPPSNDAVIITRLLDAGFHNFLIPRVDPADDARRAVAATRYPPEGIRGVSVSMRGNRYGTVSDYQRRANDEIVVAVQIESPTAVSNVDAICAVPGVDAVFIGPSDLAASLGRLGDPSHAEVQGAMRQVIERASAAGVAVGILAPAEADARRYIELGATMVAVGSDLGVFRAATQALRDRFRA
jgi:2-dehydro-3-deoxyglucarate aldolase